MNRENAKLLAPIIAAYGEGKTIQIKTHANGWSDVSDAMFNLTPDDYRIKPEPKAVYVVFDLRGIRDCFASEANAMYTANSIATGGSYKKFIEVTE